MWCDILTQLFSSAKQLFCSVAWSIVLVWSLVGLDDLLKPLSALLLCNPHSGHTYVTSSCALPRCSVTSHWCSSNGCVSSDLVISMTTVHWLKDFQASPTTHRMWPRSRFTAHSKKERTSKAAPGNSSVAPTVSLPVQFTVQLRLPETNETFSLPDCHNDLTIRKLKDHLELLAGIPLHFQRLQYLDESEDL